MFNRKTVNKIMTKYVISCRYIISIPVEVVAENETEAVTMARRVADEKDVNTGECVHAYSVILEQSEL